MKHRIKDSWHYLKLMALMFFSPATLFHRINELPWYSGMLQTWTDSLGYHKGESILEVGCATGQLTKLLARRGAIVTGVDSSSQMLRRAFSTDTAGAQFKLANALDLPFNSNRVDYVISASLINIIPDPEKALREMVRVCKPGGKVSILVPQTGMNDEDITLLAHDLNLTGFSQAALKAWHRRAPKMQRELLQDYFNRNGLNNISSESLLNGMVLTVTGSSSVNM